MVTFSYELHICWTTPQICSRLKPHGGELVAGYLIFLSWHHVRLIFIIISICCPQQRQTLLFFIVSGLVTEPSAAIFSSACCSIKMPHVESRAAHSGRGLCNLPENNLKPLMVKNNNHLHNELFCGGTGASVCGSVLITAKFWIYGCREANRAQCRDKYPPH